MQLSEDNVQVDYYLLPGTRTALQAEETARCYSHPETQLQRWVDVSKE
jgi:hypothetical protein